MVNDLEKSKVESKKPHSWRVVFVRLFGLFLLFASALFFAACSSESIEERPLAKVNGEKILVKNFLRELRVQGLLTPGDPTNKPTLPLPDAFKEQLLEQMIRNRLLVQQARLKKIEVDPVLFERHLQEVRKGFSHHEFQKLLRAQGLEESDWMVLEKERLMLELLYQTEVARQIVINDREVSGYYESHPEQFKLPEQIRVSQIVLATEAEAHHVLADMKQNPTRKFANFAKKYSIGPEAVQGGDVGYYRRGQMPEVFDKVFDLPLNQVSDVIESPYGYHIFKPVELRGARQKTLEEAQDEIRTKLRQLKEGELYDNWMADVWNKAAIVEDKNLLKKLPDRT